MTKLPLRPNVCMLVVNREGKLFLGERLGSAGLWQFPQGGVEEQGTLEENVYRELGEEIGAPREKLKILQKLKATHDYDWESPPEYAKGKWRGQSQTYWLVYFAGLDSDINLNAHHPEFMNWRWVSADDVKLLAEPKRLKGYSAALSEFKEKLAQNGWLESLEAGPPMNNLLGMIS